MPFRFADLFNNNTIVINPYGLYSSKVAGDVVVAHLSDLHEKSFGENNSELFDAVASIEPDVIAVTGDIVAHENQAAADLPYARNLALGLARIAPTFFVTGNHERFFADQICTAFDEAGAVVVDGDLHTLHVRGTTVNISGMHDAALGAHHVNSALHAFDAAEGYNIFLSHRPEIFEAFLNRNIDLILAGHTHAGQIRIPMISSMYMMGQGFFPKYMEGEFSANDTTMIISRGLGSSGYPTIRINNPPDLVAVRITAPPCG